THKYIEFDYDAMEEQAQLVMASSPPGRKGLSEERIAKNVYDGQSLLLKKSTYYILDAQGNQLSMYEVKIENSAASIHQIERNIYGSSLLGTYEKSVDMLAANPPTNSAYTQLIDQRQYAISNHLGNVLMTFKDVLIPQGNEGGSPSGYRVKLNSMSDYSPFGVALDSRTQSVSDYRHGFNGMEKDDEIKGKGNSYDFGARMLDPRVGRWFKTDPLNYKQPDQSPYKAMLNCPILYSDPDGRDEFERIQFYNEKGKLIRTADYLVKEDVYYSTGPRADANFGSVSNGWNFYSKTTKIVVSNDGKVLSEKVFTKPVVKWEDGIQDREYAMGAEDEGTIYEAGESSYEGKGDYQRGGVRLTSSSGGASPTKQKSKFVDGENNIDEFIETLGALGGGSLGSPLPDKIKDLVGMGEKAQELGVESPNGGVGGLGTGEPFINKGDSIIVAEKVKNQQGGTSTMTSKQNRKEALKQNNGKLSQKRDTLYVN
ncbi:MAG: hypothetical protein KJ941_07590, partial [Bacteroidetes bacterium]|nr:hypothetical protein [Bacteroidota bacterium]